MGIDYNSIVVGLEINLVYYSRVVFNYYKL